MIPRHGAHPFFSSVSSVFDFCARSGRGAQVPRETNTGKDMNMISKKLAKALNEQMVFEMYSSYIYLALAAALEKNKMPRAVHWMRMQADEELIHANIFFNYLTDQNAEIELDAIPKPAISAKTPLEIFQAALGHERLVSSRISKLAAQAMKENDFSTMTFLHFFITEQVQEERSVSNVIDKLEMAGSSREGLLFVDAELAARTAPVAPPSAVK